jgi:hypothetical protein
MNRFELIYCKLVLYAQYYSAREARCPMSPYTGVCAKIAFRVSEMMGLQLHIKHRAPDAHDLRIYEPRISDRESRHTSAHRSWIDPDHAVRYILVLPICAGTLRCSGLLVVKSHQAFRPRFQFRKARTPVAEVVVSTLHGCCQAPLHVVDAQTI